MSCGDYLFVIRLVFFRSFEPNEVCCALNQRNKENVAQAQVFGGFFSSSTMSDSALSAKPVTLEWPGTKLLFSFQASSHFHLKYHDMLTTTNVHHRDF